MEREQILIVDDNVDNLKLTRLLLECEGYTVRTAEDAEQALALLRTYTPALILMDIQLPGMDGLELTRRLRGISGLRELTIVALTAYAMQGDEATAIASGCDGYITKPIDTRSFPGLIRGYLDKTPASNGTEKRSAGTGSEGAAGGGSLAPALIPGDDRAQLYNQVLDCYVLAIKNMAQYAVELDESLTPTHRLHLKGLADDVAGGGAEVLTESRATLRSLLRDYRDKASQYLNNLRQELANTANALQDIFNTLSQAEGDSEARLRQAVRLLREIAAADSIDAVRSELVTATENIEQSAENIRKQHQLTVSQFIVEIRSLHQRIECLENAAALDALTHLFNRAEMEKRIFDAWDGAFLLLLRADGIRRAAAEYCPDVSQELAGAFTRRLRNCVAGGVVCGRWSEEEFMAIGPLADAAALKPKWIEEHLSGKYVCLQGGKTVHPSIRLEVRLVERPPGREAEAVLAEVRELFKESGAG